MQHNTYATSKPDFAICPTNVSCDTLNCSSEFQKTVPGNCCPGCKSQIDLKIVLFVDTNHKDQSDNKKAVDSKFEESDVEFIQNPTKGL